jgi:hypothetical protein
MFGPPVPVFDAGNIGYGERLVGSSVTRTITVTSNGLAGLGSDLKLGNLTTTGPNAADFAIARNGCSGTTLPPGSSCDVAVTFTPGATGARNATLAFADNTKAGTHSVALGGSGVVPPPAPTASLASGTYTGTQFVNLSEKDPNAVIHYTTDGSMPDATNATANGAIPVESSQTINAVAISPSGITSALASFSYVINNPPPPVDALTPVGPQQPAPSARPVKASSVRVPLALNELRLNRSYRLLALRRGLRVRFGLAPQTRSLQVLILRRTGGHRTKLAYSKELLTPARAGAYAVTLKVHSLAAGRYVIEVAPRDGDGTLGSFSKRAFSVNT